MCSSQVTLYSLTEFLATFIGHFVCDTLTIYGHGTYSLLWFVQTMFETFSIIVDLTNDVQQ